MSGEQNGEIFPAGEGRKIAVATDSGSGISQEEGRKLGIRVVPIPFDIDDRTYLEGINLDRSEFFEMIKGGARVSTAQPTLESIMRCWDELLTDNDEVIYIPLTSGLSGTCQTATLLSQHEKYRGRVFVCDNRAVSAIQKFSCLDAQELARRGYSSSQICEILVREAGHNAIYVSLNTLEFLKRGGRITPAAAAIGSLLRIKPVLQIVNGGRLDAFAKGRTRKQCSEIMLNALHHELAGKYHDPQAHHSHIACAYAGDLEAAYRMRDTLTREFPERVNEAVECEPLTLAIACHTGSGALGIGFYRLIPELEQPQ